MEPLRWRLKGKALLANIASSASLMLAHWMRRTGAAKWKRWRGVSLARRPEEACLRGRGALSTARVLCSPAWFVVAVADVSIWRKPSFSAGYGVGGSLSQRRAARVKAD